jgi:hypothetical protein
VPSCGRDTSTRYGTGQLGTTYCIVDQNIPSIMLYVMPNPVTKKLPEEGPCLVYFPMGVSRIVPLAKVEDPKKRLVSG